MIHCFIKWLGIIFIESYNNKLWKKFARILTLCVYITAEEDYFYQYFICVVKQAAALNPYTGNWKVSSFSNTVIKFAFLIYIINIGLSVYKLLQPRRTGMDKLCFGSILSSIGLSLLSLNFLSNFLVLIKSLQSQREGILKWRKQTTFHSLNHFSKH